jgi:hypothetical protein
LKEADKDKLAKTNSGRETTKRVSYQVFTFCEMFAFLAVW